MTARSVVGILAAQSGPLHRFFRGGFEPENFLRKVKMALDADNTTPTIGRLDGKADRRPYRQPRDAGPRSLTSEQLDAARMWRFDSAQPGRPQRLSANTADGSNILVTPVNALSIPSLMFEPPRRL